MKKKEVYRFMGIVLAGTMMLTNSGTVIAEEMPQTASFSEDFSMPDKNSGASIRFWWPGAPEDLEELKEEINSIAESGFKGIEIACVCDSGSSINQSENGWGTENWRNAVKTALEEAKKVGLTVDLTVGPHWPMGLPTVTPDSDASSKELQQGMTLVSPGETFEGEAPVCDTPLDEGSSVDVLKAVTVAKVTGQVTETISSWAGSYDVTKYTFDSSSMQKLDIQDGNIISFTAPEADSDYNPDDETNAGKWMVISYWMRGTDQSFSGLGGIEYTDPKSYVVDHFSKTGTQAFIDYWKENILTDDIVALLNEVGGSIFEDSLEVSGDIMWTDEFLSYFQEHRGYDLVPYLPVLYGEVQGDEDLVTRVTADYQQTLNDMYIENHLNPIKKFANSYGLTFRAQTYGGSVDSSEAGAAVDIVEGELLTFSGMGVSVTGDNTEAEWTVNNKFKMLRGAADLGNINVVSDEIGSLMNGDYCLPMDRLLGFMNSDFSAGVNNMVIHGSPYRYFRGASWPTGATFSPAGNFGGFGVALNEYVPSWQIMDESLEYMNRVQYVLQSGKSDVDIAVYRHEISTNGQTLSDGTLVDEGYTYDYVTPAMLGEDNTNAVVEDGILAPDSASYKAMVISDTEYMTAEGAKRIKEFANAGLPVVISGQLPSKAKSLGEKDKDGEIAADMESLLELENVRYVESEAEISEALKELGVSPDVDSAEKQNKLSVVHRTLENADYYYLFNRGYEDEISTTLTLEGSGSIYRLNAYSGEVTKLNEVQEENGKVTVPISIDARDTLLLAVSEDAYYAEGAKEETMCSEGDAETLELTDWNLSLESWEPENEDVSSEKAINDMEDLSRFNTKKNVYEEKLDGIIPWSDMEAYKDVSGIGTYITSVTVEEAQTNRKAILDLGTVYNGYELYINGVQVKGNQVTEKTDITEYLTVGENEIKVVVPSEMMNTLIKVRSEIYGERERNINGLTENPVLTIY